jgi:hypothetical protein
LVKVRHRTQAIHIGVDFATCAPQQVLTAKSDTKAAVSKTDQAKQLLAQYGSAYLVTSISFALVSFTACYALVTAGDAATYCSCHSTASIMLNMLCNAGVDVAALLSQVGLDVKSGSTSEAVGTFAIAYAAHKALSPVRFPPTVALTPVVARWFKKDAGKDAGSTDTGSTDADNTTQ